MAFIDVDEEGLWVHYRTPRGHKTRTFPLLMTYLGGTVADLELIAELTPKREWRVLSVRLSSGEDNHHGRPPAHPDYLLPDLMTTVWYVFPRHQRGRVVHPVITTWDFDDLTVTACLDDRYGLPHLPFAAQIAQAERPSPGSVRNICWWPDPDSWQTTRHVLRTPIPSKALSINWWDPREWFRRPDVLKGIEQDVTRIIRESRASTPALARERLRALHMTLAYSQYIRRIRTMCLHSRLRNFPLGLVNADFETAMRYIRSHSLDPARAETWAAASAAFQDMPPVYLREATDHSRIATVRAPTAAISLYSHIPGIVPPDAAGAAIALPGKPVVHLIAWFNPAVDSVEAWDRATELLVNECTRRGVKTVLTIEGVYPLEICPDCGSLQLREPNEWVCPSTPSVSPHPRVGRNDPCPCGSGKKFKKCCGRIVH